MTTEAQNRVLIVAAHADDEILGAGGTLASHRERGDSLCFLILSTSSASRGEDVLHNGKPSHREQCVRLVADMYGAQLCLGAFSDNSFDNVPQLELSQKIEEVIREFAPTIVYTHSTADLSRDHELTARATAIATRPMPGSLLRSVLSFEVRSATEWGISRVFQPTWFQPLSVEAVEMKMAALRIYESEMREWPHSRSFEAVEASLRIRGSQVGVDAAEAFELIRHVTPVNTASSRGDTEL
jgi:LmbE family N-acetylglucosaminyl deacetylase